MPEKTLEQGVKRLEEKVFVTLKFTRFHLADAFMLQMGEQRLVVAFIINPKLYLEVLKMPFKEAQDWEVKTIKEDGIEGKAYGANFYIRSYVPENEIWITDADRTDKEYLEDALHSIHYKLSGPKEVSLI